MSEQRDDIQLIEQYLAGTLPEEEIQSVRNRIASDPDFAAAVESMALGQYVARNSAKEALANSLKAGYTAKQEAIAKPFWRSDNPWMYAAAAVVILLVIIGVRGFFSDSSSDPKELFAQYYERPVPSGSRNLEGMEAWEDVVEAFREENWAIATEQLESLLADSSFLYRPRAEFYLGICRLETGQYDQAISHFRQVDAESIFRPQAQWLEALTYLQALQLDEAQQSLRQIAGQSSHYRYKEASELLKLLDMPE